MLARVGDVGTTAVEGYEVQSGDLHLQLEGAPDGPHHGFPLPRDGMIDLTVRGRPAEILITGTSGEDHDPHLIAIAASVLGLRSVALRQLVPVATDRIGLDRGLQIAQTVAMTDTPRRLATDNDLLITSEPIQVPTKSPPRVRSPPRARSPPRVRSPPRARSPPRGPAALRAPPTGPSATRNFPTPNSTQATPRANPGPSYSRAETVSPTVPPSGPRGYANPRGGGYNMRGRGGWGAPPPRSHFAPAPASLPATPPTGPSAVPTGPRASISSAPSPSIASKPFNPPTGPAAQGGQRMTHAQNLINSMPPIIPGGKIDPASTPLSTGVTRDLEAHHRRLKEEEERIREELRAKDEKLRRSLRMWERLERESKGFELKSDLSERSLKTIAGEGLGGSAF
ncbi:hypothetical protein VP1G_09299 [Cytospora mali]|uniref:Uncharacterized protein n=1 Tax=Cytospora mali TaxID=578113 RepID=A0A194VDU3_CYTMA|nr:hypothetical protein VP1G_09299 [Valsa mali var. pyri (nom. inval.)]